MKRGADEEQQDGGAAAAKRVKLEGGPSNDAADDKTEPDSLINGNDADDQSQQAGAAAKQEPKQEQQADDEDDGDAPIQLPVSTTRSAVRKGHECPYLDTILRQVRLYGPLACSSTWLPLQLHMQLQSPHMQLSHAVGASSPMARKPNAERLLCAACNTGPAHASCAVCLQPTGLAHQPVNYQQHVG
jgi:hypothetical protein